MRTGSLVLIAVGFVVACDFRDDGGSDLPYKTTRSSAGDTVVAMTTGEVPGERLRSLAAEWQTSADIDDTTNNLGDVSDMAVAPDGRVVVWDHVTPALWQYGADGKLVRHIGRPGSGPGEYDRLNGITIRPDGKLVVWDAGNARLNIYDANGDFLTTWKLPFGGHFTSRALTADRLNRTWMRSSVRPRDADFTTSRPAAFRWDSTGTVMDTVFVPEYTTNDPFLVARREESGGRSSSSTSVPYGTYFTYTISPLGFMVSGPGRPYVVNAEDGGKPLRIEREWTPVPVPDDERTQRRAATEFSLRRTQANWTWDGPDVPKEKPPYASIAVGLDGRIWVALYTESESFEPDPPRTTQENPPPQVRFRPKDRRWDVYEPDGTYLGRVVASRLFAPYAMLGDFVWGVLRDADDVPSIVKMRVNPGF